MGKRWRNLEFVDDDGGGGVKLIDCTNGNMALNRTFGNNKINFIGDCLRTRHMSSDGFEVWTFSFRA